MAGSAFNCLRNVWRNNKYSQKLKLRIYNGNVLSVLTYGCETRSITAQLGKRLQAFDNNCLRSILNIHWAERIRNGEIYIMTNHTPSLMPLESDDGCTGGTWCEWVMESLMIYIVLDTSWPLQVRETQNDHWQDVREGGEAGEVFDGGALDEGSGQVVVANHYCCLMRP